MLYCGLTALIGLCGAGSLYGRTESEQFEDKLPPVIDISGNCGYYNVKVTELRNLDKQRDSGVVKEPWIWSGRLVNFIPILKLSDDFIPGEPNFNFHFSLEVEDKSKDARVEFLVEDCSGNLVNDSIIYQASALEFSEKALEFGPVPLGQKKRLELTLTNPFPRIQFASDISFTRKSGVFTSNLTLMGFEPNQSRKLIIEYFPTREALSLVDYDLDTLQVGIQCHIYKIPLIGLGVKPHIAVNDFDAGVATVGASQCLNYDAPQPRTGFLIDNPGTDTLIVTSISPPAPPFRLSDPLSPRLPIKVDPESSVRVSELCFEPTAPGEFFAEMRVSSNASDLDTIIKLSGIAVPPGPYMQNVDYYSRRVGTTIVKNIVVRNNGSSPALITGFELSDMNAGFKIVESGITPRPDEYQPVALYPETSSLKNVTKEIIVPVEFTPATEYGKQAIIKPIFHSRSPQQPGSCWARLRGYGVLPKVEARGYAFAGMTTVNTTHPDAGKVVIKSVSSTANLYINKIEIQSAGPTPEFKFTTPPPRDIEINRGDSLTLDVEFSPAEEGIRVGKVIVRSNAANYSDLSKIDSDTIVFLTGAGLNKGMAKSRTYFPDALACSSSVSALTLKNPNKTLPLKIYAIKPYSDDTSFFRINYDFTSQPVIPPSDSLLVPIEFFPSGSIKADFQAGFRIFADRDTAVTVLIGRSIIPNVEVRSSGVQQALPGEIIGPHTDAEFGRPYGISAKSEYWDALNATSFKFEMKYKASWMRYANVIRTGAAISGWNISAREVALDSASNKLIVEASGSDPIADDGELFSPKFLLFLGDTVTFAPEIVAFELSRPVSCYSVNKSEGEVRIFVCGDQLRTVVFGAPYEIESVAPNPVSGNHLKIDFTLAFPAQTNVELMDARGAVALNILDEERPAGKNSIDVDVSQIASNVYFLRLRSGPFATTMPIIIEK